MWKGYVEHQRSNKFTTIYFDAFSNDYQVDPFLAISSELYDSIECGPEEVKKDLIHKVGRVSRGLLRGGLKQAIRIGTSGLIDGQVVDSVRDGLSKVLSDQVDSIVEEKLKTSKEDKEVFEEFKTFLEDTYVNQSGGRPVVFIIDEMDRCRPDFALDLLEVIKHFFSVKGFTFLLVVNKTQLLNNVEWRYGRDTSSMYYLEKFIDLWVHLSKERIESSPEQELAEIYFDKSIERMLEEGEHIKNEDTAKCIKFLISVTKPSYRQIEKILTYYALFENLCSTSRQQHTQILGAAYCVLKVVDPNLLNAWLTNQTDPNEIKNRLGIMDMNQDDSWYAPMLAMLLKYDFGGDTERGNVRVKEGKKYNVPSYKSPKREIDSISKVFVNFIVDPAIARAE
jgi:hypothetical protein